MRAREGFEQLVRLVSDANYDARFFLANPETGGIYPVDRIYLDDAGDIVFEHNTLTGIWVTNDD
jgi:hypothetical protein